MLYPASTTTAPASLAGEIFLYAAGRVAFESVAGENKNKKCILLGGLSDGLWPVPYTAELQQACHEENWSLVQPVLSSSYTGFGHGSLDRDVEEIDELCDYLVQHRGATTLSMVGHSTGTQDIVHYLRYGKHALHTAALQAPVSDRESSTICASYYSAAQHAADMAEYRRLALRRRSEGAGEEMMPREAFWAPITFNRYLDLHEPHGRDDYFSSDYTDADLKARLGHVSAKASQCLLAVSGADEYVPESVDSKKLLERLCMAIGPAAVPLFLETGNHNLSSVQGADATRFVVKMKQLLAKNVMAERENK